MDDGEEGRARAMKKGVTEWIGGIHAFRIRVVGCCVSIGVGVRIIVENIRPHALLLCNARNRMK